VIRDSLIAAITQRPDGLTTEALLGTLPAIPQRPSDMAAVDAVLLLSPEVRRDGGLWKIAQKGKTGRILAAIENYAQHTGRSIFRLSSALQALPAHEHPTEDELKRILSVTDGRYELLRNAMIRRRT
jgi:hypothetical protein